MSQETQTDLVEQAYAIEHSPLFCIPLLGKLIVDRQRMHLISEMMASWNAPSHAQEGWISRLIPRIENWGKNTLIRVINEGLRSFFSHEIEVGTRRPVFDQSEGPSLDMFLLFGMYGSIIGVDGPIVRWALNMKIWERERNYRINQVVEAMSMVVLKGQIDGFSYNKPEALKSIRVTLERLKEFADPARQELAQFTIRLINTTIFQLAFIQ